MEITPKVYILKDDKCECIAICQTKETAEYVLDYSKTLTSKWVNLRVEERMLYTLDYIKQVHEKIGASHV